MKISIRAAASNDLDWINTQYKSIGFKLSNLIDENVVIAEVDTTKAGLGRLRKVDYSIAELGGIYVLPEFRKLGIARKIVSKLLCFGKAYKDIYCLPYEHLVQFYSSFGFKTPQNTEELPEAVVKKHMWCKKTYVQDVSLLVLKY